VDDDGLCRPCVVAVREDIQAGIDTVVPGPTQLHLYVLGLGRQGARNLPRPRGGATPYLGPRGVKRLIDDPLICPVVTPGQQTLFPVRRRIERAHARRISARTWPEEGVLYALAEQRAAKAGLAATWPQTVMRLIRCALAIRDAEGELLVAQEMLDQVRLPLKAAAAEILAQAGILRPRTTPPPVLWPTRSCGDCASWGITWALCRGCSEWRRNPERYPVGQCPRCQRAGLPLHRQDRFCRGCLVYVRERGPQIAEVSCTQLTFAGPLAHQLKRRAGELGFVAHKSSGPVKRARARARTTAAPADGAASMPVGRGQMSLFSMPRTWRREQHVTPIALSPLPGRAQDLLEAFTTSYPRTCLADKRSVPGGAALVLHTLLARLGPHVSIPERDVRSLAGTVAAGTAATRRVISFLAEHTLLEADELSETPVQLLTDVQHQADKADDRAPNLGTERRDRHDERALHERIAQLPEQTADQLRAWVRVMRGLGRYEHPPAAYRRIRRYLRIAWPTLTSWAAAGMDLRQITTDHIQAELDRHEGNLARGLLSVLRSIFRALKQERLIFRNPTAGLQAPAAVQLPLPIASDQLAGALDRLDGPAARLIVGLVAIHAVRAVEVARLDLADPDLARRTLAVRRGEYTHTVYLDDLSTHLLADWLRERRRRWPQATNPHLIITSQSYRHPASPQLSYCALRAAFDQIGLLPRQVWADRILDEARETADPVHLVRLFGIHPGVAVKYVHAAHPDKALPRIR
jgi:integrase